MIIRIWYNICGTWFSVLEYQLVFERAQTSQINGPMQGCAMKIKKKQLPVKIFCVERMYFEAQ